jgi:hypothetical protein
MHETINGGGFIPDSGLGSKQETQGEGYDIDEEPLFGQDDNHMDDTTADAAMDEIDTDRYLDADDRKKKSQRTARYSGKEDRCLRPS